MRHFGRVCGSHFINPLFLVSSHKTVFSIRKVCGLRHLLLINDFKMYSNEKSLFWLGNETLSLVLAPVSKAVILPSPYSKKPFLDLSSLHCLETNITQKLAHCIRSAASTDQWPKRSLETISLSLKGGNQDLTCDNAGFRFDNAGLKFDNTIIKFDNA